MAGFLPQVDKLQALLKDEMSFKDKLEMARMGKSRQLAENYLPMLANSQNLEEATQIQQAIIADAAKYGVKDLVPELSKMYDAKVNLFKERQEIQKAEGDIRSLFNTYAGYKMKNPLNPEGPTILVGDYINKWKEAQGPSAYLNVNKLTYAIENNITEEKVEAGLTGTVQKPIIIVKSGNKGKYGGISDAEYKTYVYDTEGKIAFVDSNDNKKYDKGEELADMTDPNVVKQMEQADTNLNQYQAEQRANQELALRAEGLNLERIRTNLALKKDATLSLGEGNAFVVSSVANLQKNLNFKAAFEENIKYTAKNGRTTQNSILNLLSSGGQNAYLALKMYNSANIARMLAAYNSGDLSALENDSDANELKGNIAALKRELDRVVREYPDLATNVVVEAARDDLDFLTTISNATTLQLPLSDNDFNFGAGRDNRITSGAIPTLRNTTKKARMRTVR